MQSFLHLHVHRHLEKCYSSWWLYPFQILLGCLPILKFLEIVKVHHHCHRNKSTVDSGGMGVVRQKDLILFCDLFPHVLEIFFDQFFQLLQLLDVFL